MVAWGTLGEQTAIRTWCHEERQEVAAPAFAHTHLRAFSSSGANPTAIFRSARAPTARWKPSPAQTRSRISRFQGRWKSCLVQHPANAVIRHVKRVKLRAPGGCVSGADRRKRPPARAAMRLTVESSPRVSCLGWPDLQTGSLLCSIGSYQARNSLLRRPSIPLWIICDRAVAPACEVPSCGILAPRCMLLHDHSTGVIEESDRAFL